MVASRYAKICMALSEGTFSDIFLSEDGNLTPEDILYVLDNLKIPWYNTKMDIYNYCNISSIISAEVLDRLVHLWPLTTLEYFASLLTQEQLNYCIEYGITKNTISIIALVGIHFNPDQARRLLYAVACKTKRTKIYVNPELLRLACAPEKGE